MVISRFPVAGSGSRLGGDRPLVDPPASFDLDVVIVSEQGIDAVDLAVGEQTGASVQGAPCLLERVVGEAARP